MTKPLGMAKLPKIDVFCRDDLNHNLLSRIKLHTPTGASTNPKNFDLNKNLNMNLILIET